MTLSQTITKAQEEFDENDEQHWDINARVRHQVKNFITSLLTLQAKEIMESCVPEESELYQDYQTPELNNFARGLHRGHQECRADILTRMKEYIES